MYLFLCLDHTCSQDLTGTDNAVSCAELYPTLSKGSPRVWSTRISAEMQSIGKSILAARAAHMITYRGPWLPCTWSEADIDKRFHWLQWGHPFHHDSWFFSMEMLRYNLCALSCLQLYNIYFGGVKLNSNNPKSGIYPGLLHILDLTVYPDLYPSSFLVWTDRPNIFNGRTRDERLQEIYLKYVQWCRDNRPLSSACISFISLFGF
jgi:hypothetical protein